MLGAWELLVRDKDDELEESSTAIEKANESKGIPQETKHAYDDVKKGGMVRNLKGPDWNCESCGNVNWCWRSNCNKCNTSKPKTIMSNEVRVGTGGGFLERQERVSSMAVEIAEDGYDDFGRRLKKTDTKSSNEAARLADEAAALKKKKEAAALARLQASYGNNSTSIVAEDNNSNNNKLEKYN